MTNILHSFKIDGVLNWHVMASGFNLPAIKAEVERDWPRSKITYVGDNLPEAIANGPGPSRATVETRPPLSPSPEFVQGVLRNTKPIVFESASALESAEQSIAKAYANL